MPAPTRQVLSPGREHWRHGPIDLVIEAWGDPAALHAAYSSAWQRFGEVLTELVAELGILKAPLTPAICTSGPVALRMVAACRPFLPEFITPMAAVAGSVADEIVRFFAVPGIERAYVNNGGDIAIHLAAGHALRVGIVPDAHAPAVGGGMLLRAADAVRGVATSGWRGRSFSLGIADSVTVLATSAAAADAAATLIANAVDLDHPAVRRQPASEVKDDSDLGMRLVTVYVGALPARGVAVALDRGVAVAATCLERGLILGAALALQGQWRTTGSAALALPSQDTAAECAA